MCQDRSAHATLPQQWVTLAQKDGVPFQTRRTQLEACQNALNHKLNKYYTYRKHTACIRMSVMYYTIPKIGIGWPGNNKDSRFTRMPVK